MNNVLLKMKAPTDIASNRGSRNLVKLHGQPDVDKSYHTKSTSSKPLSLNPDCFNGGSHPFMRESRDLMDRTTLARRFTFKAVWGQRCFRYLDCSTGGLWRSEDGRKPPVRVTTSGIRHVKHPRATTRAVYLSSSLDRILKDNQGGCLYEWPEVKSLVQEGTGLTVTAVQLKVVVPLKHVTDQDYWQKPGIGPMAVRKSSPNKGTVKRKGNLSR